MIRRIYRQEDMGRRTLKEQLSFIDIAGKLCQAAEDKVVDFSKIEKMVDKCPSQYPSDDILKAVCASLVYHYNMDINFDTVDTNQLVREIKVMYNNNTLADLVQ